MEKIVRIGILGCANIAKRSIIPAILGLKDHFDLAGIASRNFSKAGVFAELFNTRAIEGYHNLIGLPGLEAVYIPLPNSLHREWVEKALLRNLHVLVEKSLACEFDDAKYLNELAAEKGLVLVENFQFRFHKQLQSIIGYVNQGKIGELRCLRSSFGFPGLADPNDIRYQKSLGGGALLDTGAYPLKISQLFLGDEIEVKAASLNTPPNKEVDITGGAFVKQKNGELFGELAFGFDNYYQCNLELWGSRGKIYTNRIFTAHKDYEPVIEIETREGRESLQLPADDHFKNMLKHFYHLIHTPNPENLNNEYLQNINQARLIHEVKQKANEK